MLTVGCYGCCVIKLCAFKIWNCELTALTCLCFPSLWVSLCPRDLSCIHSLPKSVICYVPRRSDGNSGKYLATTRVNVGLLHLFKYQFLGTQSMHKQNQSLFCNFLMLLQTEVGFFLNLTPLPSFLDTLFFRGE